MVEGKGEGGSEQAMLRAGRRECVLPVKPCHFPSLHTHTHTHTLAHKVIHIYTFIQIHTYIHKHTLRHRNTHKMRERDGEGNSE